MSVLICHALNAFGTQMTPAIKQKTKEAAPVLRHMTWRERVYGKKEDNEQDDDARSFKSLHGDEDGSETGTIT